MDKDILRKALAENAARLGKSHDGSQPIFMPERERTGDPGIECLAAIIRRIKLLMHQTRNNKAERLRIIRYVKSRVDEWCEELANDISDVGGTLQPEEGATAPAPEPFDIGEGDEEFFPEQLSEEEIEAVLFENEKGIL